MQGLDPRPQGAYMPQRPLEESTEAKGLRRASLRDGDIWRREGECPEAAKNRCPCYLLPLLADGDCICIIYIAF